MSVLELVLVLLLYNMVIGEIIIMHSNASIIGATVSLILISISIVTQLNDDDVLLVTVVVVGVVVIVVKS